MHVVDVVEIKSRRSNCEGPAHVAGVGWGIRVSEGQDRRQEACRGKAKRRFMDGSEGGNKVGWCERR